MLFLALVVVVFVLFEAVVVVDVAVEGCDVLVSALLTPRITLAGKMKDVGCDLGAQTMS